MARRRYGYGSRRPRQRLRRSRPKRGNGDPISLLVIIGFILVPPLLIIVGIIWLIVKLVRRSESKEDKAYLINFTIRDTEPSTPQAVSQTGGAWEKPDVAPAQFALPERDYFRMSEAHLKYYWGLAFYQNLSFFTGDSITHTDYYHGLIYYYLIDEQVRYVGQTRENTLKWRMNRPHTDGSIGYNFYIKRNMLQAASDNRLSIKTWVVPKNQLDSYEQAEIKRYAPSNRLWNQEYNDYFDPDNFYG